VDRLKPKLRSLDLGYLAVMLQPQFEETIEVDQFDVNGAVAGLAPRFL